MRRSFTRFLPGLAAIVLLAAGSSLISPATQAAPLPGVPTTYCGDPSTDGSVSTADGTMITCETAVANTIVAIDAGTGVATGGSVVRVTECTGPANGRLDPADLTCTTSEQILVGLVTAINQCNGVGYGGGNVLECSVAVTNTFVGVSPQAFSAATVNQCNGSAPDTTGCVPFPANTTGATITQCNNSSYGGGQEDFNCTASGTTTASLRVTVNQCNNSNYGGGSWLNCSASVTNVLGAVTPSSSASGPVVPSGSAAVVPTGQATSGPSVPAAAPTTRGSLPIAAQLSSTGNQASPTITLPDTAGSAATSSVSGTVPFGLIAALLVLAAGIGSMTTFARGRRR